MIEHLPPDSPWVRSHDPWTQTDYLLWNIESRLRDLAMIERTALAALSAGLHIRGNPAPPEAKYITPPAQRRTENLEDVRALERSELAALMHR